MAATEQEMMERAARIQTIEELREACAEFGVEMSPEDEQAFMAAKAELRELSEGGTGRLGRRIEFFRPRIAVYKPVRHLRPMGWLGFR
ncbi:hypothetical protein [Eggerthella lenta]|uniref:hypothetical protein n=1 Tax=Eggerthella lenta TaxID=84112 RepID=UPI00232E321C|nr:hypothetical protein [Eggerthella lenta]MDB1775438.1 hypothetical protein [Eggerthella lenta]MDB1784615.1 hypothetical protein [Eggerthella lenta]MDB1790500.1 hypothetical protein [Eggerthella lenta]